jgi:hypothetical protein
MLLSTDMPSLPWQAPHCFEIAPPFFGSGAAPNAVPAKATIAAIVISVVRMHWFSDASRGFQVARRRGSLSSQSETLIGLRKQPVVEYAGFPKPSPPHRRCADPRVGIRYRVGSLSPPYRCGCGGSIACCLQSTLAGIQCRGIRSGGGL